MHSYNFVVSRLSERNNHLTINNYSFKEANQSNPKLQSQKQVL